MLVNTNPEVFDWTLISIDSLIITKLDSDLVEEWGVELKSFRLVLLLDTDNSIFDLFSSLILFNPGRLFLVVDSVICWWLFILILGPALYF